MRRIALWTAMALGLAGPAIADDDHDELLGRVLERMRAEIRLLPDYTCTQSIERRSRAHESKPWSVVDTLQLEVALVNGRELYSKAGARTFSDKPLADIVKKGTVSTGQFGLLAHHVFVSSKAKYTYKGMNERSGAPAHEWEYDVAPGDSSYTLRTAGAESVVGFQGSFWVNPETLDLWRLDVQAYDIPDKLGVAEADTTLHYARVTVNDREALLPASASLRVVGVDGLESLNRMRLNLCRHYAASSAISFEGVIEPASPAPTPVVTAAADDTARTSVFMELALDSDVDLDKAKLGDVVKARLTRALTGDGGALVPQGAVVRGTLVRLQREAQPFPLYEVGLTLEAIEIDGRESPVSATMLDAGPAAGLIREEKRLDPTFTKKRRNRMEILVREVQKGEGILHWDARKGALPRGLKMKWRLEDEGATYRASAKEPEPK